MDMKLEMGPHATLQEKCKVHTAAPSSLGAGRGSPPHQTGWSLTGQPLLLTGSCDLRGAGKWWHV